MRLTSPPPGPAQRHRVRQVDQQGDGGAGPALGLDHLEVVDLDACTGVPAPVLQHRVAYGPDDIERLLVAELPLPGRAGGLTGGARVAGVVVAPAVERADARRSAQRGLAEPPHPARRQGELAAAALRGSPAAAARARSGAAR